jgi:hypothetical protein
MNGIIAFCGAKFSGKSTSAELFKNLTTLPTEELAFAGHLKTASSEAFGVDMKYFLDPNLKEAELPEYVNLTGNNLKKLMELFNVTPEFDKNIRPHVGQVFYTGRSLLQYIGTDVLHPIDPLIHVKVTLAKKDPNKLSIITDLRFPQEFDACHAMQDFVGVYVKNAAAENKAFADKHASEQGWKVFKDKCTILDNNGNLSQLQANLTQLVKDKYESQQR